jgi:class 3 adenylate cyclase
MSLSDQQLEEIGLHAEELQENIYRRAQVCGTCMPWDEGEVVWLTKHWPLSDTVREVLEDWDGLGKRSYDDDELQQVLGFLNLECPGCGAQWDEMETLVGREPKPEPVDLPLLSGRRPKIVANRKRIIVAFGDISGFSKWNARAAVSESQVRKLMSKVYAEFVRLEHKTGYFTKPLGDGIMFVQDLTGRNSDRKLAETFMIHVRDIALAMNSIISKDVSPRPKGFRIRVVVGEAWKLRVADPNTKSHRLDYIGYPVTLAARLLAVLPGARLICNEGAKELIEHSARLGPKLNKARTKAMPRKGTDPCDLKSLWKVAV